MRMDEINLAAKKTSELPITIYLIVASSVPLAKMKCTICENEMNLDSAVFWLWKICL
jgi:uncharacterized protein YlaI